MKYKDKRIIKARKVIMIVEKKWLGYVLRNLFAIKGVKVVYSDSPLEKISLRHVKTVLGCSDVLILDATGRHQKMVHKLIQIRDGLPDAETICVAVNGESAFRSVFKEARMHSFIAPHDSLAYVYRKIRRILGKRIKKKTNEREK